MASFQNETATHDFGPQPDGEKQSTRSRPVVVVFDQQELSNWHLLVKKETTLGRDERADVVLNGDTVSRIHAKIVFENIDRPWEEPVCTVHDNGSRNGTFLNGVRVRVPAGLTNADRIFLGNLCLGYFVRTELEINTDQRLRTMATTDQLTGLMNRGYMAIQFQKEFERARRYGRPLALMMIDVDDFKKVNDTYGHASGDVVLSTVAKHISARSRIHDVAARYGGEEFAVLLPETNIQGAIVMAERLRRAITGYEFEIPGASLHVSVSIGVGEMSSLPNETLESLVARADGALLQAKAQGKDQVVVPPDSPFTPSQIPES